MSRDWTGQQPPSGMQVREFADIIRKLSDEMETLKAAQVRLRIDLLFIRDQARDITEAKGRAMMALRRLEE